VVRYFFLVEDLCSWTEVFRNRNIRL